MVPMRPLFPDSPVAPAVERSCQTTFLHPSALPNMIMLVCKSTSPVVPMRPLLPDSPVDPAMERNCQTVSPSPRTHGGEAWGHQTCLGRRERLTCGAHEATVSRQPGGSCNGAQLSNGLLTFLG